VSRSEHSIFFVSEKFRCKIQDLSASEGNLAISGKVLGLLAFSESIDLEFEIAIVLIFVH
jgi:hypothetical protein